MEEEEDQSSCDVAWRQDLEDLLWVLYSLWCSGADGSVILKLHQSDTAPSPSLPKKGNTVAMLYYCSSSRGWCYCTCAGQWEGSIPSVPSQYAAYSGLWPIVGCVLGEESIFQRYSFGSLSVFRREIPKYLKYINVFCLFCFFFPAW